MPIRIAGAGPAGLCAAINLCRLGERVKVFEKADWVGRRFHPNLQGLRYLYCPPEEFMRKVGLQAKVKFRYFPKAIICTRRRVVELDCSKGSLMPFVIRGTAGEGKSQSLDAALYREAEKEGVEFEFNKPLKPAQADIVACGSLGEPDQAAVGSVFEGASFPEGTQLVMFDDRYSPKGWYCYMLPIRKDAVEFVTCVSKEHIPALSRLHSKAIKECKVIRDYLDGGRRIAFFGGSAHCSIPKSAVFGGRYYVGESAGFQDPYMGFGIAYALRSGCLAARAIANGEDYDGLWKKEFGYYLRKDAAYRLVMSLAGDLAAELLMLKYKSGQKVNLSEALPEKNWLYRALVEGVGLLACLKRQVAGSW